ncbi:MAG: hypothetical protein KC657_36070 [Myxococcales bacterium]|nr:hypothetical protein [Myxococcales bacterium]
MGPDGPDEQTESPFEYVPFEHLYSRALSDVANRRLDQLERKAAARALAFLLRERVVTERVATDVLTALYNSLDVAKVVRTLLLGLHDAPESDDRMTMWTRRTAERALAAGHVPSFVAALRILVGLGDFEGAVPTSWQVALLRAAEDPDRRRRAQAFLLRDEYARRFGAEPRWVRTVRARQLIEAVRRPRDREAHEQCPSTVGDHT